MSMTHDEMISVIEHHKNGGKVEFIRSDGTWKLVPGNLPSWNFQRETYRIKPEPMTLWLEINQSTRLAMASHERIPTAQCFPSATLKKFVEVTE